MKTRQNEAVLRVGRIGNSSLFVRVGRLTGLGAGLLPGDGFAGFWGRERKMEGRP